MRAQHVSRHQAGRSAHAVDHVTAAYTALVAHRLPWCAATSDTHLPSAAPAATPSCSTSTGRTAGHVASNAATTHISVVPGLEKHTRRPAAEAARTTSSAPVTVGVRVAEGGGEGVQRWGRAFQDGEVNGSRHGCQQGQDTCIKGMGHHYNYRSMAGCACWCMHLEVG